MKRSGWPRWMGDDGLARSALASAATALAAVSASPRLDAELLMAHAMGVSRDHLLLRQLDASAPPAFAALLACRLAHEPIAYITGIDAQAPFPVAMISEISIPEVLLL